MAIILLPPGFYYSAVILLGLLGGWMFYKVWRLLMPRGRSGEMLGPVFTHLRGMTGSEETSDLLRHYRALLGALARYAARNLLAVLAAVIPATALYYFLAELHVLGPAVALPPDRNPLRQWLDDAEFIFFVAVTVGSIAGAILGRRRGGVKE